MAKLLSKWFPKSRKRIKPGLQDGKRWRIYEAGWMALNDADHEDVSIVHVAKTAGVSIGTFYRRFPNKASFLDFTVDNRLSQSSERTAKALELQRWRRASNAKTVAGIVEHLVVAMHGDMRGAVRTAFRRRRPGRDEHCPLKNYQTVVADASVGLLLERLGGGRRREDDIRAATQIILATVMGSLLQDPGPLKMQRQRTIDVLTQVMVAQIGLDRSRGKDGDQAYPDALIEVPPVTAEAADPARVNRALAKEKQERTQSPTPPKGKKASKGGAGEGCAEASAIHLASAGIECAGFGRSKITCVHPGATFDPIMQFRSAIANGAAQLFGKAVHRRVGANSEASAQIRPTGRRLHVRLEEDQSV